MRELIGATTDGDQAYSRLKARNDRHGLRQSSSNLELLQVWCSQNNLAFISKPL